MGDTGLGIAGEVLRIIVEPNTFVAIAGTSLGGSMKQRVTITKDNTDYLLGGDGKVLMLNDSASDCLTFLPTTQRTSLFIVFEAAKRKGGDYIASAVHPDYKQTKHIIDGFATYYTFHSEDGGDNDYNDCTLAVALIA
ncbi:hypothetical protein B0H11DRAFT_1916406 [Mycena galericulata]|nr:hypothetical protein B0H11DRAFT_1916406 [Mycena galericulata]